MNSSLTSSAVRRKALPKRRALANGTRCANAHRLVVVDMRCQVVEVLKDSFTAPRDGLFGTLVSATRAGHLDIQADDGQWGGWNLRTNRWDPQICCDQPPHRLWAASLPNGAFTASPLGQLLRPVVLGYSTMVAFFALMAFRVGHRGAGILGQAAVVMPLKAVWLVIVLTIAVNLIVVAGLVRSGALASVASGTIDSATRAWRR
jgi:hypothetical protein